MYRNDLKTFKMTLQSQSNLSYLNFCGTANKKSITQIGKSVHNTIPGNFINQKVLLYYFISGGCTKPISTKCQHYFRVIVADNRGQMST